MNAKTRFAAFAIPAIMAGLCWLMSQDKPDLANHAAGEHEIPLVAFQGQGVRQYEEPLPEGALIRFGSTRFRHPTDLSYFFAHDIGNYVLTELGGTFTLTNKRTGQRTRTEKVEVASRDDYSSLHCAASPDGKRIVAWRNYPSGPSVASLWEVNSQASPALVPIAVLQFPNNDRINVNQVRFTCDSDRIILDTDSVVVHYDAGTGLQQSLVTTKDYIQGVSSDGLRFLTSNVADPRNSSSGVYELLSMPQYGFREFKLGNQVLGNGIREFEVGDSDPNKVEYLQLKVCHGVIGHELAELTIPRFAWDVVRPLDLSADGKHVCYGFNRDVYVWNVDRQEQVLHVRPGLSWKTLRRQQFADFKFSADGSRFVIQELSGAERQFDLKSGLELSTGDESVSARSRVKKDNPITSQGFIRHDPANGSSGYARLVMDVSPDGQHLAIGDGLGRIDIWHIDGHLEKSLQSGGKDISAVAYSPDGKQLAVCDWNCVLRIWDCRTGKERERIQIPADHVDLYPTHLTFSPDCERLLISRGNIMTMLEIAAKKYLWEHGGMLGEGVSSVPQFSPDGRNIVFRGNYPWLDVETGEHRENSVHRTGDQMRAWRILNRDPIKYGPAIALSPKEQVVACIDNEGSLLVWDLVDDRLVQVFPESLSFDSAARSLRFSPDGHRLLTFNYRGQLQVWEIASGQLARTLNYPNGYMNDARFGLDGRTIITSNHREVIIWDLKPTTRITDPWEALGHDAPVAEQARQTLLADPKHAITYIEKRLQPTPVLDETRISRAITRLEHKDFREREWATAELIVYGRGVLPRLQKTQLASEEGNARLASLVRMLSAGPTANEMRRIRSAEILEQARYALR